MNIVEILQPFNSLPAPTALSTELRNAMEQQDIFSVDRILTELKTYYSTEDDLQHLITHFTSELADVFEKHGFRYAELPNMAKIVDIPKQVWERAHTMNSEARNHSWFSQACKTWNMKDGSNEVQRWNSLNYIQLHCAQIPDHLFVFISNIIQSFEHSFVGWSAREWDYLATISQQQWSEALSEGETRDEILRKQPDKLQNLHYIFAQLPAMAAALNEHYTDIHAQYQTIVQSFSSVKGLKGSVAYKNLSANKKKSFLEYLDETYGDDSCSDNITVGYKHLLNMTEEDFFLRRFERFDYENLYQELKKAHPGFEEIFFSQLALSPFHVLMENPDVALTLDQKFGPEMAECLNDARVLQQLLYHDDIGKNLAGLFERFPEIVHWKDTKGNTLAHWYAVYQICDDNMINVFCSYPALLESNHAGFTVRDILQQDIEEGLLDADVLVGLDHHILTSHVANIKSKTSTQRKM